MEISSPQKVVEWMITWAFLLYQLDLVFQNWRNNISLNMMITRSFFWKLWPIAWFVWIITSTNSIQVEAYAEVLHMEVRKQYWGYAPDENLSVADLIKVKYQGIRPAPGYPSQPDHTEKTTMWNLLQVSIVTSLSLICVGKGKSRHWTDRVPGDVSCSQCLWALFC